MASNFGFAIDRGGTFTDIYCEFTNSSGHKQSKVAKLLSENPGHYRDAPTEAIRQILEEVTGLPHPQGSPVDTSRISWIRMGTTIATNALLERKGARTALLITKGFKDLLLIGNQSRPAIFELNIKKPKKLFEQVVEINERVIFHPEGETVGVTGEKLRVETPLNVQELTEQLEALKSQGICSLAVCLLHSYTFRTHEAQILAVAESLGFPNISLSSAIIPKIKVLPRASTACIDAYLTPKIKEYLFNFSSGFKDSLSGVPVLFMQSDGGLVAMEHFVGCRAVLSGPAGGVVGFANTGPAPLIGFDMGGTSTDVSRYGGTLELLFEGETAGVAIQTPQLDISTVAAGGGSRLFFRSGLYIVGPESAGASPGPLSYRKNGFLALTDANLVLRRLVVAEFPRIFGANEDEPLSFELAYEGMQAMAVQINEYEGSSLTVEEVAHGFVKVANEAMCRPIRELTQARGFDPKSHSLACFGGAGGQHACAVARSLGMGRIVVHRYSGVLSAYGLGLADVIWEETTPCLQKFTEELFTGKIRSDLEWLKTRSSEKLLGQGCSGGAIVLNEYLHLRFSGTDTALPVLLQDGNPLEQFYKNHQREFGFVFSQRDVIVDEIRVRGVGQSRILTEEDIQEAPNSAPVGFTDVWVQEDSALVLRTAPLFALESLAPGQAVPGPAIILNSTSTVLIEPLCTAHTTAQGNLTITVVQAPTTMFSTECDPVLLSVFSHRFMSIAEQMGRTLQRTSVSTNIKERLDYSCAVFNPVGALVANAPHLPVHLGSMQEAVKFQIKTLGSSWAEGEVVMSNHPSAGGSHLPDITVITPVYLAGEPVFYVASRGHHADIGGVTPGSMPPFSKVLAEEGLAVCSFCLVTAGEFREREVRQLFSESRCVEDNVADLKAQIAANHKGTELLLGLISEYSLRTVHSYMDYIQNAACCTVKDLLSQIAVKNTRLAATDCLDDGTPICLEITIDQETSSAVFDFTGTGHEVLGNLNTPPAVLKSAILYCLRCLVNSEIPLNQGCLDPISIRTPELSVISPSAEAAVVGGNVLTSQRITDVIFKAFSACAASQGCMNNFTFGNSSFGFYETIAGGAGAGPGWHGASGVHTHMTNTRITDIEIMELRYPVIIRQFGLRQHSGGKGQWDGGEGVVREFEFSEEVQVCILSERRTHPPYGMNGGSPGALGLNLWRKQTGQQVNIGAKNSLWVRPGERIMILTPGGGGFGVASLEN